ncbi:MAG: hypothetical protein QHJ82_01090 [Verrucomicrobiota bacterium]|nr:hypothetical protein [Verrucomicrobiota bacterium]
MKRKTIAWLVAVGLLVGGSTALMAQGGPGPRGRGYGGPPRSEQERAERQANCPWAKDSRGAGLKGQARGQRAPGDAKGKAYRRGLRDGTGPRAQGGNCPYAGQTPADKQQ